MLATKTLSDGTVENWVWDGLALIRRGGDIYVNEPHISGGVPIVSKTKDGVRYHEHDFLETTLWSMDTKGKVVKDYQDTTIFGEGSIQHDRSARFTGKPYDEDLQAYVFPYRNYDASTARWRTSDPAGYPDGVNQHFYAAVPTMELDSLGMWIITYTNITAIGPSSPVEVSSTDSKVNVFLSGSASVKITREASDLGSQTFNIATSVHGPDNSSSTGTARIVILSNEKSYETTVNALGIQVSVGIGSYSYSFSIGTASGNGAFSVVEK